MALGLDRQDRRLLEVALRLANLRRDDHGALAERVTSILERSPAFRRPGLEFVDELTPDTPSDLAWIKKGLNADDIDDALMRLKDWLGGIAESRALERIRSEVANDLGGLGWVSVTIFRRQRLATVRYPRFTSFEQVLAYATALLLDQNRGLGRRLAICKADHCGCFVLDRREVMKGGPQRWCEHHRRDRAERSKVYMRERRKRGR